MKKNGFYAENVDMKKFCYFFICLLFVSTHSLFAERFLYQYTEGERYKVLSTVKEDVLVNGIFNHYAEIVNRISYEVTDVETDDLGNSKFSSYEKHLIFRYTYLDYPISSFNKNERDVINTYLNEVRRNKPRVYKYSEVMYEMPFETIEIGSKNSNIQFVKEDDERLLEEKKEFKSQILKSGF